MTRRSPSQYNWDKLDFDETIIPKNFTPANRKIKGCVIHHMIVLNRDINQPDALDACYDIWVRQGREASAHYGVDGRFVRQYVWDKDIAWANANAAANRDYIAVEHANMTLDQTGTQNDYKVDEETWKNGARLMAYIHKVYNIGRPSSNTIHRHHNFYATACPGPYMDRIYGAYVEFAAKTYDAITGKKTNAPAIPKPKPATNGIYVVKSGDTLHKIARMHKTTVAKLALLNGIANPSLIRVGQKIKLTGSPQRAVTRQIVNEVIALRWGVGNDRFNRLRAAGYDPIAVQNEVNRVLG